MKKIFTLFAALLMASSMMTKAETIELKFDNSDTPLLEYYDGDWYLAWISDDNKYTLYLDYLTTEENKFGHYTLADLDLEYSGLTDNEIEEDLLFTDADFTISPAGDRSFTLSGYVVCEDGNTYTLNGHYEAPAFPEGTPSVTSFGSLDDLKDMTISFTGNLHLLDEPYGIALFSTDENTLYALAPMEYCTFEDNVLTISYFVGNPENPMPTEEMDMMFVAMEMFEEQEKEFIVMPVHYVPGGTTAISSATVDMKKVGKFVKNGKLYILKNGKRYNAAGQNM